MGEISKDEYKKRIIENTAEYFKQEKENSFDLKKYHGFDKLAGEISKWVLASKTYDILSAVILGFLPILIDKHGFDAIKLENDAFVPVELKSSYTDESKFYKTKNNAIYSVTANKIINGCVDKNATTSFKSNYNASYEIKGNKDSKGIDTYLIINDSKSDKIIDCFVIRGSEMERYLDSRIIPMSGSVTIKLATFERLGHRYDKTIIPVCGINEWKVSLLPFLETISVTNPVRKRVK